MQRKTLGYLIFAIGFAISFAISVAGFTLGILVASALGMSSYGALVVIVAVIGATTVIDRAVDWIDRLWARHDRPPPLTQQANPRHDGG